MMALYAIRHRESGRQYIGVTKNVARRWKEHRDALAGHRHVNPPLQADWNRDGSDAFELVILQPYTDPRTMLQAESEMLHELRVTAPETLYNRHFASRPNHWKYGLHLNTPAGEEHQP